MKKKIGIIDEGEKILEVANISLNEYQPFNVSDIVCQSHEPYFFGLFLSVSLIMARPSPGQLWQH